MTRLASSSSSRSRAAPPPWARLLWACASLGVAAALLLQLRPAWAADHLVTQKNRAFAMSALTIKVGDRVTFRNEDTVAHNIFSLTDPMPFDLGTFGPGKTKDVVFTKEGKFDVECSIHTGMQMTVTVTK